MVDERVCDFSFDFHDSALHARACVAIGIAVAQLDGFTRAGRRSRGYACDTNGAVAKRDRDFEGRASSGVEDLQRLHTAQPIDHV